MALARWSKSTTSTWILGGAFQIFSFSFSFDWSSFEGGETLFSDELVGLFWSGGVAFLRGEVYIFFFPGGGVFLGGDCDKIL